MCWTTNPTGKLRRATIGHLPNYWCQAVDTALVTSIPERDEGNIVSNERSKCPAFFRDPFIFIRQEITLSTGSKCGILARAFLIGRQGFFELCDAVARHPM